MSVPYYRDPAARRALLSAAVHWDGTRYCARGAVPGPRGGVGCVRHSIALHVATGAIEPIADAAVPAYQDDWSAHHDRSLLEEALAAEGLLAAPAAGSTRWEGVPHRSARIDDWLALEVGDLILFRPGRVPHHLGTVIDGRYMQHALKGWGVQTVALDSVQSYRGRAQALETWFAYALRFLRR